MSDEYPTKLATLYEAVRQEILNTPSMTSITERVDVQSAALREIAKILFEEGINVSRFTKPTQEVLVAVALNGDY